MTHSEYLLANDFKFVGHTGPYSYYEKPDSAVGICGNCGIVITGKHVVNNAGQCSIPAFVRHRWWKRSIKELESFINQISHG